MTGALLSLSTRTPARGITAIGKIEARMDANVIDETPMVYNFKDEVAYSDTDTPPPVLRSPICGMGGSWICQRKTPCHRNAIPL